jgi:uncharacterized damage-inducible protein DinB
MKCFVVLAALALSSVVSAQSVSLIDMAKTGFNRTNDLIARSADKMSEADFAFKATPDVRSFGQIVGHITEAQYSFCSTLAGEPSPGKGIEKSKTTKADLVAALAASKDYCKTAIDAITEGKIVKAGPREVPALGVVFNLVGHNWEHYGNLVTYMRLKNIVPPSSEPQR